MGSKRCSTVVTRVAAISSFALVAMGAFSTASAVDYDDALRTYSVAIDGKPDPSNVNRAIDTWRRNALAGDILSRVALGDLYSFHHISPPIDDRKRPVAPPAPRDTGVVREDKVEALAWYTIAATQDFSDYAGRKPEYREINAKVHARDRMPVLQAEMTTEMVKEAHERVVSILSGESQSAFDLYRIGEMYQRGDGLPKDNVEAYKYFKLAIDRGQGVNANAIEALNSVREMMSEKEFKSAQRLIDTWQPPLPSHYTAASPMQIALERENAELREQQAAIAMEKIEKEFNDRNEHILQTALAALGLYLDEIDGQMGPKTRQAIRNFQYNLVEDDDNLTEDQKRNVMTGRLTGRQKIELVKRAAERNHPQSAYILGVIYAEGIGERPNGEKAVSWLKKSATYGYPLAHFALGRYYRDGIYGEDAVEPSREDASFHFGQAAALGLDEAQRELVEMKYEWNFAQ